MKRNPNNVLFAILALVIVLALAVFFVAIAADMITYTAIVAFISSLDFNNVLFKVVVAAIGLVMFTIFAGYIFTLGSSKGNEGGNGASSALVKTTDIGSTYMTMQAIDGMIQKHVRSNNRVRNCSSRIIIKDSGISVELKLELMPDTNIPEITSQLQKTLKEYVESLSGIFVDNIKIIVVNANINPKGRVE